MSLFEFTAAELQKRTDLEEQMVVVINQVLPRELQLRGVENPEGVCGDLSQAVKGFESEDGEPAGASPEDVFRRLSRS
jgi:hypothetical protein